MAESLFTLALQGADCTTKFYDCTDAACTSGSETLPLKKSGTAYVLTADKTQYVFPQNSDTGNILLVSPFFKWPAYFKDDVTTWIPSIATCVSKPKISPEEKWDIEAIDTARDVSYLTKKEKDVILFINMARTQPALFAKTYLEGKKVLGGAYLDAYEELLKTAPMPPLQPSKALALSTKAHAKDLGTSGKTGHVGSDGSTLSERIKKFGAWVGNIAENCFYGESTPFDIDLALIVDEGVASKGHRKNILNPALKFIGVSIQPHNSPFKSTCVQDFATLIEDK